MKTLDNNFIILTTPSPVSHRTAEENLGIGYLAAVLRNNGFDVKIIDGWLMGLTPSELAQKITQERTPLFVGVSAYQSNIDQAIKTLNIIRRHKSIPFVVGGFGPTFSPELFLNSGFDITMRGEAEKSILDIAKYFQHKIDIKQINGVSYKHDNKIIHNPLMPLSININDIPYPARDTINQVIEKRTPVHLLTARGCTNFCSFCSIASFFKLSGSCRWRGRDIDNIINELKLLANMGVKHIKVIDDSFIDGPRDENWAKEFCEKIKENNININLRGSIRADKVSYKIIEYLKEYGFFAFSCGIENFSLSALKRMGKAASVKQNRYALNAFKEYDMYVQAGQILFDPYTTMSELWENYYHMKDYDWVISKGVFTEMFAATGTPFQKNITRKNLVKFKNEQLGNHSYLMEDKQTRLVYNALKKWHMSNMYLYDKTIDPLTSPKALNQHEMQLFYIEYLKIHQKDLQVMRSILDIVEYGGQKPKTDNFIENELENSKKLFSQIELNINKAYQQCNLQYNANINPFIKAR